MDLSDDDLQLHCIIEGESEAFPVNVQGSSWHNPKFNVGHLKKRIQEERNNGSLAGVDAHILVLWKPKATNPIDVNLDDLASIRSDEQVAEKLTSARSICYFFPTQPSLDRLHIVVWKPGIAPRKRLRSATEEDGQAAKRKEIEEVSETRNKLGDATDIRNCCVAIHDVIKAMPHDLDLSNPSTFSTLPFPSLLKMPSQCFEIQDVNDVDHFDYMGRYWFGELRDRIQDMKFLKGFESLHLYGTSGSGKSHLLAALAYNLVREGSRVFYIPDCSTLLLEPAKTMWAALNFAFYDSAVLGTIGNLPEVEELIELMSGHSDLYIIVDQVNALESTGNDSRKAQKVQALNWLDALRSTIATYSALQLTKPPIEKLIGSKVQFRFSEYLEG